MSADAAIFGVIEEEGDVDVVELAEREGIRRRRPDILGLLHARVVTARQLTRCGRTFQPYATDSVVDRVDSAGAIHLAGRVSASLFQQKKLARREPQDGSRHFGKPPQ